MKAAVLQATGQLSVEARTEPEIHPNEVLVNVRACGICGTDQHIYHGQPGSTQVTFPIVLGHELAGEVIRAGTGVTDLAVGDRVSIDPNIYCGECRFCRDGRNQLCEHLQAIGVTRDGGMSEWCAVPADNCYKIPDTLTDVEAALIEPLGCVLHGFNRLTVRPDDTVLIIGGGFIGQLFLQLLKTKSPQFIAVSEPAVNKHEKLRQLGANAVFNPYLSETPLGMKPKADIVIECVGRKESMEMAFSSAGRGGQVLLFGVSSPQVDISISPYDIFTKELTILGSFINPNTHAEAIKLVQSRLIDVESLVTHRFRLEELPKVMEDYPMMQVGKGVVEL